MSVIYLQQTIELMSKTKSTELKKLAEYGEVKQTADGIKYLKIDYERMYKSNNKNSQ